MLLLTGGPGWEPTSPRSAMSTTQKIRSIGREARVNQLISERLEHWKAAMRERGHTLALFCFKMYSATRCMHGFCVRLRPGAAEWFIGSSHGQNAIHISYTFHEA